jgi:hypothetical protein
MIIVTKRVIVVYFLPCCTIIDKGDDEPDKQGKRDQYTEFKPLNLIPKVHEYTHNVGRFQDRQDKECRIDRPFRNVVVEIKTSQYLNDRNDRQDKGYLPDFGNLSFTF